MALSQTFKDAVASRDLLKIRLLMSNELLVDPSFRIFKEMEEAVKGISGLYVPFDGGALDSDSAHWDDSYLALQQTKLVSNFCKDRIDHVKKIIQKLHPAKAMSATEGCSSGEKSRNGGDSGDLSRSQRPRTYEEQKQADAARGDIIKVVGCCGVGAVIGGGAAAVIEGSVLSGAIAGAVIGLGIGFLISEE